MCEQKKRGCINDINAVKEFLLGRKKTEKKLEKTAVIFRRYPKSQGGEVIALFPQVPGTNDPYTCSAYVHMGQHTNADPVLVIRQTKRARLCEQDVKDLKRELEHYGAPECPYRLDVRQKYLYSHQKSREAELKRQRKEWQAEGQANGK